MSRFAVAGGEFVDLFREEFGLAVTVFEVVRQDLAQGRLLEFLVGERSRKSQDLENQSRDLAVVVFGLGAVVQKLVTDE